MEALMDDYLTPEAAALADDLEQRFTDDPDFVADDSAGDLVADGRQVVRAGRVVRVTTWAGRGASEHASEAKARVAFDALAG